MTREHWAYLEEEKLEHYRELSARYQIADGPAGVNIPADERVECLVDLWEFVYQEIDSRDFPKELDWDIDPITGSIFSEWG